MSSAGGFASGRLWSLWDIMFNFHLIDIIHLIWMLDFYERTPLTKEPAPAQSSGILADLAPKFSENLSQVDRASAREILDHVKKVASTLRLPTTSHRIDVFELKLRYQLTGDDYRTQIKVLRDALNHDLSQCYFYYYPFEKAEVLLKFGTSWAHVFAAFKDTIKDTEAAYDCYALGRDTASIFHIMRVAELGLRVLARERRVTLPRKKPVDWATWQEIISELGKEATRIGQKASPGPAKDNALSFYSGALSDLNAFKDEYRNQVMHVRKEYDEHQSLRALVKVHAFMERLAEKITDESPRIKWGLKFRNP